MIDCDRLPHQDFFDAITVLEPGQVAYCSKLYQISKPETLSTIVNYFTNPISPDFAKLDARATITQGTIKPTKNPMSGCVAFWVSDYYKSGGMSTDFVGWGFNDTDYYMKAYTSDLKFLAYPFLEFHLHHDYTIPKRQWLAMNAWNAVLFYDKWKLPLHEDLDQLFDYLGVTADFIRNMPLDLFTETVG